MEGRSRSFSLFSIGMAMFSMFFGAGNIVFPLIIGQQTVDQLLFALVGLLLTAVIVPFMGVFAVLLYEGDYKKFFSRLGVWPGFLIAALIMGLIGPFGALPRCIALSYSTIHLFFESATMIPCTLLCCFLVYLATVKKTRVIDMVGWVLSPFFLLSIALIVVFGIFHHPDTAPLSSFDPSASFMLGLVSGYNTMDLLSAFFFSTVCVNSLKTLSLSKEGLDRTRLIKNALISSTIGAVLLAAVYIGMSYVAALHSSSLVGCQPQDLLSLIAMQVLGPYAGIVTCLAVVFACLTTAIALASVFAEFFQTVICKNRVSYQVSLIMTLLLTFLVSTLEFGGILKVLAPIVQLLYPLLALLSVVNIIYRLRQQRTSC